MQLVDVKTILPSIEDSRQQQEQEIIVQNLLSSITPFEVTSFFISNYNLMCPLFFHFINASWIISQELELGTDSAVVDRNIDSFIVDELSVMHYRKDFDEATGETSFKLVLLDFLEFPVESTSPSMKSPEVPI